MAAQVPTDIDSFVALVVGTQPSESSSLLSVLKKLDKAAEQQATSSSSASAPRQTATSARAAAAASSSSTSSSAAAPAAAPAAAAAPSAPAHLLEGKLKDGQDPLDVLVPAAHTVGYLYVLNVRLAASNPDLATLGPKIIAFAEQFNQDEARKVGEQVSYLANQLISLAESSGQPTLPVVALKTLVQRYPDAGYLTHLHPLFLQVVLQTGLYPVALEVLQEDITDVDKQLYPIRYQDHLLYHYLGGTILALLGEYARAADLLEIAVSAPGSSASMIQIDAYKKMVLVQLLAYGKTQPLPKYTTQALGQAVKTLCVAYNEYAAAFMSLDRKRVGQVREKAREVFEKDLNYGLVALCEHSLRQRQIQHLTQTYITQSLGEIAAHVGMDPSDEKQVEEVEEEVRGMIATKQIFGSLSPPTPGQPKAATTVTFKDDPEPFVNAETVARVTKAIEEAQALERAWAEEGRRVAEGKEFVQKAYAAAALGGTAASGFGPLSGMGGFSDDFDYAAASGGIPGAWGVNDDIDIDSD
ncbi:hypothetical protein JCM10213_000147 [Rhodosporidiobolus nylandii]